MPLFGTADGGFALGSSLPKSTPACGWFVAYDQLTLAIGSGGRLSGNGQGRVVHLHDGGSNDLSVSMSLVGVPDAEPPALSMVSDGDVPEPFARFSLVGSELRGARAPS